MLLTDQIVAALTMPEGKSEHIVFDDREPGFGLRLRGGGKRTWIVQYRAGGQQRRVTIGKARDHTTAAARKLAKIEKARVTDGKDPQGDRLAERDRADTTVLSVIDGYLAIQKAKMLAGGKPRASTYEAVERYLKRHWAILHQIPAHLLTQKQVFQRLLQITQEHGPISANRAKSALSAAFAWGMRNGLVDTKFQPLNPAALVDAIGIETKRERYLSHAELREVWHHSGDEGFGTIVKLLVLLGQRRDEVGGIARSEVDFTKGLWTLPASRAKNRVKHVLPLPEAAIELLLSIPDPEPDRPRDMFFGQGAGGFGGWSKSKARLDARIAKARTKAAAAAGVPVEPMPPWRLHDLRRTFSTLVSEDLDALPHAREAVLNHIASKDSGKQGNEGTYNRAEYLSAKRQLLDAWAAHVATIVVAKS